MRRAIGAAAGVIAAIASLRWLVGRREDIDWRRAPFPGRVVTVDGVGVHYIERGSGPPVVLIHGFGGHTYSYRYLIPDLARDHRVIAVDLKGYGYSERPAKDDYSLTAQARLVVRLMDELGIERASVAGHSLGGEVVMRIAAGWPDRVERLVFAASVSGDRIPTLPVTPLIKPFVWLFGRLFGRWLFRRMFYDKSKATKEVLEAYRRPYRIKGTGNAVYQTLRDARREGPVKSSGIKQPVLILWASHERILPRRTLDSLLRRLPAAEVVHIDRAGHLLLEEQPEACNAAIRRFLTGAPSPGEAIDVAQTVS